MNETLQTLGTILLLLAAVGGSCGYFIVSYRKGDMKGISETFTLKDHQIKALQDEVAGLREDLDEVKKDAKKLLEKLDDVTKENEQLRNLISLKELPPAMIEFFENNRKLHSKEIQGVQTEITALVNAIQELSNNVFLVQTREKKQL